MESPWIPGKYSYTVGGKLLLVFYFNVEEKGAFRMEDLETPIQLILGLRLVIDLMILGMVASPDLLLNQLSDVFNFRV